jgi:hypothetical protein
MRKLTVVIAVLTGLGATASPAFGQSVRTWVSENGNDANPCSATAPCKTFAGAISKTFIGGEIDAMDDAGFGTVTITKSVTIDGGGHLASILASSVNGITIHIAANPDDPMRRVVLRGLYINGTGITGGTVGTNTGIAGVNITTEGANTIALENVHIDNFLQHGIKVMPGAGSPPQLSLSLKNVFVKNTAGGNPANALELKPGAGHQVNALIQDSQFQSSRAFGGAPAGTSGAGILADSGSHVWLTGDTVFDNQIGLQAQSSLGSPGVFDSFCDNVITGNADNGTAPNELCPKPPTQIVNQPVEVPVTQCIVPKLKGLPTAFAKKLLKAANCALGKVTKTKVRKRSQVGKVLSQKTRAGTTHAKGTKVAVTVGKR